MKLQEMIKLETKPGQPVAVGDLSIRPEAQALQVRFPWGGLVLNRPVGVLVDDGERVERIPIVDVTRTAQIFLLAMAGVFILMRWREEISAKG